MTTHNERRWQVVGMVVFVVAGLLLLSMGGAIVAAPVSVPLMFVAASRHPTRAFRTAAVVMSSLTLAEVAWALAYLASGERKPWIWLVPSLSAAMSALVFAAILRPGPRPGSNW